MKSETVLVVSCTVHCDAVHIIPVFYTSIPACMCFCTRFCFHIFLRFSLCCVKRGDKSHFSMCSITPPCHYCGGCAPDLLGEGRVSSAPFFFFFHQRNDHVLWLDFWASCFASSLDVTHSHMSLFCTFELAMVIIFDNYKMYFVLVVLIEGYQVSMHVNSESLC